MRQEESKPDFKQLAIDIEARFQIAINSAQEYLDNELRNIKIEYEKGLIKVRRESFEPYKNQLLNELNEERTTKENLAHNEYIRRVTEANRIAAEERRELERQQEREKIVENMEIDKIIKPLSPDQEADMRRQLEADYKEWDGSQKNKYIVYENK